MEVKGAQGKYWCFTNFDLDVVYEDWNKMTYLCYGEEICPTTKRKHHQGYVEFSSNMRLSALKKINNSIHWELRRGTQEQAIGYTKGGEAYKKPINTVWVEMGERKSNNQGQRTDLIVLRDGIKAKKTDEALLNELTSLQSVKCINTVRGILMKHRTTKPKVIWRWGLSGLGKTRWIKDKHGEENCYIKDGTKWWEGYNQEEAIIIDDFDGKWPFRDFLRLLDYGRYQGEVKGGHVKINSPYIYITCEFPPEHFYEDLTGIGIGMEVGGNTRPLLSQNTDNTLKQVLRRIDEIHHITEPLY